MLHRSTWWLMAGSSSLSIRSSRGGGHGQGSRAPSMVQVDPQRIRMNIIPTATHRESEHGAHARAPWAHAH